MLMHFFIIFFKALKGCTFFTYCIVFMTIDIQLNKQGKQIGCKCTYDNKKKKLKVSLYALIDNNSNFKCAIFCLTNL